MTDSQLVQFLPLHSVISPNFWHTLTNLKLNHLRLSEETISIKATYGVGRVAKDGVGLGGGLTLDEGSFDGPSTSTQTTSSSLTIPTNGTLLNYNTAPQFTSSDKNAIFNDVSAGILDDLLTSARPTDALARFTILAFADLKKYKYYHWVAVPALVPSVNWCTASGWESVGEERQAIRDALLGHVQKFRDDTNAGFALVKRDAGTKQVTLAPVVEFERFFEGVPQDERTVLFIDPSASPNVPGWPLRNLLALLSARFGVRKIRVVAWRDELGAQASTHSITAVVSMHENTQGVKAVVRNGTSLPLAPLPNDPTRPSATGWERNAQGKLAPKVSDLGPLMDPKRLASQAVDLNLKLMRWRIMPEIQLEKVSSTKCLLLGAGTLGCHVARILLGWGVRHITFVDSSRVSYSNPVRQPLFEFEDCTNGGKPKAECAAMRLEKVFPGVQAQGVQMSIPMPGHGVLSGSAEQDVRRLEGLIDEHDVVFLLMDSRESRWLPTLLAASRDKLVINAALGFDTYLVMRHGAGPGEVAEQTQQHPQSDYSKGPKRLGCYFCNDIVAPADSLTDRTLDQMCTVSRPGLAAIAGASAVELMVSLLQHEGGIHAPAPLPSSSSTSSHPTCLGILPHQIRGHLSTFNSTNITGSSYDKCTACSSTVVNEYREKGWEGMLKFALSTEGYLEKLTGLDKMYEETERLLSQVEEGGEDWSEDDEE